MNKGIIVLVCSCDFPGLGDMPPKRWYGTGYHMLVDDLIHFRSKRWKRCVSVVFVLTPPMCAMVKRWYILEL